LLAYPQDEHEKLLVSRLEALGVPVERPVELVGLEQEDDRVTARLRHADGSTEACEATYLAGCDGARSFVREALGIGYHGGTYSHLFYVADVEGAGPTLNGEAHFDLDDDGNFLACIPLRRGQARLIGILREDAERKKGDRLGWDDVNGRVIERLAIHVDRVNWFSTYRVHHRVASDFRNGRIFLVGDAAHIHSPVGGQGMNTGIGDAVNLAWKLAAVLHGHADPYVLESYERERMPFAKRLVRTTDRLFELLSARGAVVAKLRVGIAPRILAGLSRSEKTRLFLFRTVSQVGVKYRNSWLSEGRAGRIHGGDRLPWVSFDQVHDNFEKLTAFGWQIQVYGEPSHYLRVASAARHLPLRVFAWDARADEAGFARDAAYLVRPDGYVALAAPPPRAAEHLGRYLAAHHIEFGEGGTV